MHGLSSTIKNKGACVSVCENPCTLDESESGSVTAKCKVPSLATSYSVEHYKIEEETTLSGTVFSTSSATMYALTDEDNNNGYIDSSPTCNFGMYFKSGYVGVVNQVKFFMNDFVKSTVSGKLSV